MENNLNQNSKNNKKESKKDLKEKDMKKNELNNNENHKNEEEISNIMNNNNNRIEENIDEPIYIMTLALEQGKSEKIEIFANSDPAELAYDFCNKNNLDFNALDYLKEQISNLLESYAKNENEEDYIENNDENKDINVPEIEEVQEEFNITENYKEDLKCSKSNLEESNNNNNIENMNDNCNNYLIEEIGQRDLKNKKENKISNNEKIKNNNNLNKEYEDIMDNNKLNIENKDGMKIKENNKNDEHLLEDINIIKEDKKIENENLSDNKIQEINSNIINNSKRRNYKVNEDIIIGIDELDNNINYKLSEISEKKEIKKTNDYKNNEKKENKMLLDQNLTNYFNQETKTNTNTNIIQNDDVEKNNICYPKNHQDLYHNIEFEKLKNTEGKKNYKKINKIKPKENTFNIDKRKNFKNDNNKNITNRKMIKLKEEYDNKYSFKPVINDNYKTDLSFNERLNMFNNISKLKKEELKKNLSNLKDKESGQNFFKPKLISKQLSFVKNKNKKEKDEIENMDIFNKNYLYLEKYNLNKKNLYNKLYKDKGHPKFYSKIESEKIINESNRKAFSNLFNILDSDQDNLITSVSINLNNIPEKIIKIIEPLLIELKEDNQTLNQDEFIKAMNKLFENISFTKRRELINEYNKNNLRFKTPIFNSNFGTKIKKKISNKNTNKLAEKHYLKMQKMMDVYNIKYNNKSSSNKTSKSIYKQFINHNNDKNNKFSFINDCTFNNYLKNLN